MNSCEKLYKIKSYKHFFRDHVISSHQVTRIVQNLWRATKKEYFDESWPNLTLLKLTTKRNFSIWKRRESWPHHHIASKNEKLWILPTSRKKILHRSQMMQVGFYFNLNSFGSKSKFSKKTATFDKLSAP